MPSSTVNDGSAMEVACRRRSAASVSTGAPTAADEGLLTDCQPSVGVAICVTVAGAAEIAPGVWHVAVTVISPVEGMTTEMGRFHRLLLMSCATPFVIVAPTCP